MLEEIKTLLGIKDKLQDDVLGVIIKNVTSHLVGLLGKLGKPIPAELNYIIVEISVRRFNRLGTEGMKSETVEGHKVDFYDLDKDFDPFLGIIEAHKDVVPEAPKRGKVIFL